MTTKTEKPASHLMTATVNSGALSLAQRVTRTNILPDTFSLTNNPGIAAETVWSPFAAIGAGGMVHLHGSSWSRPSCLDGDIMKSAQELQRQLDSIGKVTPTPKQKLPAFGIWADKKKDALEIESELRGEWA